MRRPDLQGQYSGANGIFLVLVDDGEIVGTGAVRRLDADTCELKRMWFLKEYRGKGLGMQMAEMLLGFARASGYKKMRLDTGRRQEQAVRLYQRLGFTFIERYNDGPGLSSWKRYSNVSSSLSRSCGLLRTVRMLLFRRCLQ